LAFIVEWIRGGKGPDGAGDAPRGGALIELLPLVHRMIIAADFLNTRGSFVW
jgi:hypothetical protein